jgi:membrane protease YdiL (CAAX protease family)
VATVAFTVLVGGTLVVVQTVLAIPYLILKVAASPKTDIHRAAAALRSDGLFLGLGEVVGGAIALGLIVLIAWLRRGPSVREYLALRPVARLTLLRWLLYMAVLGALLDGVSYLFGYATVPDWMLDIYRSAVFMPLLLFALLVVAPVLEEVLFRGFLFEGLRHSRLRDAGAIVVASLGWAVIHLQYDWFYVGQIFVLGLVLGAARLVSRSLVPPIAMHALYSGIATLQVALQSW